MHFATHFDHNYFHHGMALIQSLERHCRPYRLTILALTDECETRLENAFPCGTARGTLPSYISIIRPEQLKYFSLYASLRESRTWVEWCWMLEPALCWHMLHAAGENFTYVDADQWFVRPFEPTIPANAQVALTPHYFPEGSTKAQSAGRYNFGLGWFRNSLAARTVVAKWLWQTMEACGEKTCGHQTYLDQWQQDLGDRLHEFPMGINLGPWSLPDVDADLQLIPKNPAEGGTLPVVSYHFHECRYNARGRIEREVDGKRFRLSNYSLSDGILERLYAPYVRELCRWL